MSWSLLNVSKLDLLSNLSKGACTRSQKPTETGTETFDTETACGIMALSQTTGHGTYFQSLVDETIGGKKSE